MLNEKVYTIEFYRFHTPLLLIDVKSLDITCDLTNKFLFFIENPRVNIQVVSGFFDFYFKEKPDDYMLGQVVSKILISYRSIQSIWETSENYQGMIDFFPCVLFTKGLQLQEILIYMPFQKPTYLRELRMHFVPKMQGSCVICFEEGSKMINLHQDQFHHSVCMNCYMKLDNQCPMCRQLINVS
jgi:hypothetical protein